MRNTLETSTHVKLEISSGLWVLPTSAKKWLQHSTNHNGIKILTDPKWCQICVAKANTIATTLTNCQRIHHGNISLWLHILLTQTTTWVSTLLNKQPNRSPLFVSHSSLQLIAEYFTFFLLKLNLADQVVSPKYKPEV